MNLEPAPRQSKLVFLAIDAGLLLGAFVIVFFAKDPYAPLPFISAVTCVVVAAVIGLIPFLTDYAADSAEYVQAERSRVAEQVQRLHNASESLARAAAQIKAVEEAVHKTATAAENLPYRMQEKLVEFNETLATKDTEEREALERELDELRAVNSDSLKGAADKIAKVTSDWTSLESSTRNQLTAAQLASAKLTDQLQVTVEQLAARIAEINRSTLAQLEARLAELDKAAAKSLPAPTPVEPAPRAPAVQVELPPAAAMPPVPPAPSVPAAPSVIESVTLTENPAAPDEEAKAKKPRAPRKPRPEETLASLAADPIAESTAPAENFPTPASSDESIAPTVIEASSSSDGATRLLVTAYIGIGNKLFIRGEGPGLSWEKGIPMQFVSIGKWGWASHDVTAPVRAKLYKNDETAALSGDITVEPGKHVEFTALF